MIRLLLFASVFTTSILLCGTELQTVEGALQSKSIQVTKDGQRVQAELQNVQLTIPFPNGKIGQADIVMLHEPQSGLFWWRYQAIEPGHFASTWAEDFLSSYKVYITEDKIVVFTFSRPFVWVRESSEHCSTLAEGQASVLATLKNKSREIQSGTIVWFHGVNVAKALGPSFLILKGSASPFPEPKIREISKRDGEWRIILDGPNKDAAEVVMSDDYQVVSAARLPAQER